MSPHLTLPVVLLVFGLIDVALSYVFRRQGKATLALALFLGGAALVVTALVMFLLNPAP
ncbi:MAG TPA: hypothetical protein VD948_13365 [Rhodothermales bacterium]|nr:hypothetical protein [Rhodothermales bacterium]